MKPRYVYTLRLVEFDQKTRVAKPLEAGKTKLHGQSIDQLREKAKSHVEKMGRVVRSLSVGVNEIVVVVFDASRKPIDSKKTVPASRFRIGQ